MRGPAEETAGHEPGDRIRKLGIFLTGDGSTSVTTKIRTQCEIRFLAPELKFNDVS